MFGFLKKLIKSDDQNPTVADLKDENGNVVKKSSVIYSKSKERFLKLNDDCCAMIIYPDNNVEIIFTKVYDPNEQKITDNEETLMSLALFMKQPGFGDMIKQEFRKIAMENISKLTDQDKGN